MAVGSLCVAKIDAASCNGGQLFPARGTRRILATAGLGGPMTMTEVEKSSRSILERTFYAKLGPTPAFPPSPAEPGQVKPVQR